MKVLPFIADSAEDAVAQIRAQLGPEAVVLNVRPIAASGLSRLWQKPRIEVLACLPDKPPFDPGAPPIETSAPTPRPGPAIEPLTPDLVPPPSAVAPSAETRGNYQASVYARHAEAPRSMPQPAVSAPPMDSPAFNLRNYGGWRVGELLEAGGLLPRFAQRIIDRAKSVHGERPPDNAAEELHVVRQILAQAWNTGEGHVPQRCRVFIGAPGVGKSTALCKWLVQSVLVESRTARVWRLDSHLANTAESVSVFCDILRVPMERALNPAPFPEEVLFVDLPGVNANDPSAIASLKGHLAALPDKEVYLVLNAAYETPVLLAQVRAFSSLPVQGLIFTHLDEEARWGKIWNFVFGTNYTVRFLSAGQNVPGDFFEATPARLAARILP